MGKRPKLHGDKDRLIPAELRDAVLEYIDAGDANPHAAIAILLGDQAGLRISEVVKLRAADCDIKRAPYRLLIRGAKHRQADHVDEQPIGDELAEELRRQLARVHADELNCCVMGGRTSPYTRQHALALAKEIHRACDVPEIYNFHSWRHGYGTRIYLETKDLLLTSRMLRHRSTKPTERYVHMATALEQMGKVLSAVAATSKRRKKSPKTPQRRPGRRKGK